MFVLFAVGDAQLAVLLDEEPVALLVDDQREAVAFGLSAIVDGALEQSCGAQAQDRVALAAGEAVRAGKDVHVDAGSSGRQVEV
jgi:hypothetical protein